MICRYLRSSSSDPDLRAAPKLIARSTKYQVEGTGIYFRMRTLHCHQPGCKYPKCQKTRLWVSLSCVLFDSAYLNQQDV